MARGRNAGAHVGESAVSTNGVPSAAGRHSTSSASRSFQSSGWSPSWVAAPSPHRSSIAAAGRDEAPATPKHHQLPVFHCSLPLHAHANIASTVTVSAIKFHMS